MIRTFIAKGRAELTSKTERAHSMRNGPGFLLQCLLLKMKSSSAYRHLSKMNILPLPSSSTIRSLLSSTPCKFGYNEIALETIKRHFERLNLSPQSRKRWGNLIWDEVTLKKDLSFDKHLLEWNWRILETESKAQFQKDLPTMHWFLFFGRTMAAGYNQ